MINSIAIAFSNETLSEPASQLARQLKLKVDNQARAQLLLTPEKLVLKMGGFKPIYADFSSKTWQKRRDAGKQQGLVRACKPGPGLRIIDATAGWGRDAAILASFGAQVLMIERQPIMAALLKDALVRQDEKSQKNLQLRLIVEDAARYLQTLDPKAYPDVIYLDPMHPERQKSALVKKEMQVLQQLLGPDLDALYLLELALDKALKRVVVKWPQQSPPLLPPDSRVEGKSIRFDIYYPRALSKSG